MNKKYTGNVQKLTVLLSQLTSQNRLFKAKYMNEKDYTNRQKIGQNYEKNRRKHNC